jgi:hypothetical protein
MGASAVTGIIERLERAGYVRREPDPADRRKILVIADQSRVPDLAGIFGDLGKEMSAFMAKLRPLAPSPRPETSLSVPYGLSTGTTYQSLPKTVANSTRASRQRGTANGARI